MNYTFNFMFDTFRGKVKKTGEEKDFYVVRLGLYKDGILVKKSEPLLWLSEEQYKDYISLNK